MDAVQLLNFAMENFQARKSQKQDALTLQTYLEKENIPFWEATSLKQQVLEKLKLSYQVINPSTITPIFIGLSALIWLLWFNPEGSMLLLLKCCLPASGITIMAILAYRQFNTDIAVLEHHQKMLRRLYKALKVYYDQQLEIQGPNVCRMIMEELDDVLPVKQQHTLALLKTFYPEIEDLARFVAERYSKRQHEPNSTTPSSH